MIAERKLKRRAAEIAERRQLRIDLELLIEISFLRQGGLSAIVAQDWALLSDKESMSRPRADNERKMLYLSSKRRAAEIAERKQLRIDLELLIEISFLR